jgi:hypothetical protein
LIAANFVKEIEAMGYFDVYAPYRRFIDTQQYTEAIDGGLNLLSHRRTLSPATYSAEHKGTPFYIMGYAAFASHDYTTASFYFDAAVAEDLKNHATNTNTPALLFMQLDDNSQPVLAQHLISELKIVTKDLVDDYNTRVGSHQITIGFSP